MADSPQNSRNLTVFGVTSLLNDTASEMAYWVLPGLLITLGAGPAQLGIIEGVAESVAAGLKLWSGALTDRLRKRKPLVVWGYAVANLAKPLLAFAGSWWHVLLIRFADRAAKGMRGAPRDVMLAESVAKEKLGSAYGLLQAMDTAGAILGPLLALWMLMHWELKTVLLAAAVPGALCVLIVALFTQETKHHLQSEGIASDADPHHDFPQRSEIVAEEKSNPEQRSAAHFPRAYYFLLFVTTFFTLSNSSDMFLVLRAQEQGMTLAQAPLFGLVFNITYTIFSWPAGHLSDRMPRHIPAALGYLVYAIVYAVFAWAPSLMSLWGAMAFYGLFYALTAPVTKALIIDSVAPEMRGRALGIQSAAGSVATLLASLLTGALWKTFGGAVPLGAAAVIALISAVMMMFYKSPKNEERAPKKS